MATIKPTTEEPETTTHGGLTDGYWYAEISPEQAIAEAREQGRQQGLKEAIAWLNREGRFHLAYRLETTLIAPTVDKKPGGVL